MQLWKDEQDELQENHKLHHVSDVTNPREMPREMPAMPRAASRRAAQAQAQERMAGCDTGDILPAPPIDTCAHVVGAHAHAAADARFDSMHADIQTILGVCLCVCVSVCVWRERERERERIWLGQRGWRVLSF